MLLRKPRRVLRRHVGVLLVRRVEGRVEAAGPIPAEAVIADKPEGPHFPALPVLIHQVLHRHIAGIIALHVGHHDPPPAGPLGVEDALRLLHADGHRLLHEHVLACLQQVDGDLALAVEVPGNADGLDVGVLGEFHVAGVKPGDSVAILDLSPQFGPNLGNSGQLAVLHRHDVRNVHLLRHEPAADITDLHFAHCVPSSIVQPVRPPRASPMRPHSDGLSYAPANRKSTLR